MLMVHTSVPTLGYNVFTGCNSLEAIYVPRALVDQFKSAENWSAYADKIIGYSNGGGTN